MTDDIRWRRNNSEIEARRRTFIILGVSLSALGPLAAVVMALHSPLARHVAPMKLATFIWCGVRGVGNRHRRRASAAVIVARTAIMCARIVYLHRSSRVIIMLQASFMTCLASHACALACGGILANIHCAAGASARRRNRRRWRMAWQRMSRALTSGMAAAYVSSACAGH